jgi:hypothetical protein
LTRTQMGISLPEETNDPGPRFSYLSLIHQSISLVFTKR